MEVHLGIGTQSRGISSICIIFGGAHGYEAKVSGHRFKCKARDHARAVEIERVGISVVRVVLNHNTVQGLGQSEFSILFNPTEASEGSQ